MRYYVVALDNNTFIGLEISDYLSDDYDAMVKRTRDYLLGNINKPSSGIRFRGVARKMDYEVKKLYTEWFKEMNISGNAIPYNLSEKSFSGARGLFLMGVIMLFTPIILLISEFKRMRSRKKAKFYITKAGKTNEVKYFWDNIL
ncbi:MAG: hypothetical protein GX129_07475 [Clostridiales bacterium]|jgi:hypothetical protein|nr:hypothetical protein [Clostridiales bacterium]